MIYHILSIIVALIILIITVIIWAWYKNPKDVITWLNTRIDKDDEVIINAWDSGDKNIIEMNQLIVINHDDILAEVNDIIKDYDNITMNEIPSINEEWLKNEDKWRPIWIRFMGEWSKTANKLPTLKRIASLFPNINMLYVSVFHPGMTIIQHKGVERSVHRYHYGLKIPENDIGLKIGNTDVKWEEKEGFIWDDTISHSAWNDTDQERIVIFADVFKDLSMINTISSNMIYSLSQRTKYVMDIKDRLKM